MFYAISKQQEMIRKDIGNMPKEKAEVYKVPAKYNSNKKQTDSARFKKNKKQKQDSTRMVLNTM